MPHHQGGPGSCTKVHTRVFEQALCEYGFESLIPLDTDYHSESLHVKQQELQRWIALFGLSLLGWEKTFGASKDAQPVCLKQRHWDVGNNDLVREWALKMCFFMLTHRSSADQTAVLLESFMDALKMADWEESAREGRLQTSDLKERPWTAFFALTLNSLGWLLPLKVSALRHAARGTGDAQKEAACAALKIAIDFGIHKLNAAELIAVLLLTQGWTDYAGAYSWLFSIQDSSALHSSNPEQFHQQSTRFMAILPVPAPDVRSQAPQAGRSLAKSAMSTRKLRLYGF
ncbi:hypothetical protein ACM66B_005352 [Microbotryomycetes sp. NB124-2]